MSINYLHINISARIARGDLIEIDRQLSKEWGIDGQWLLLVKMALTAIANLTDLERTIRQIYLKHPSGNCSPLRAR